MRKVPKLRFREFSDEWEEKKFKDFLIEKKEIANEDLELYSLTIENGIIPKNEKYEREFLVNNKEEAYKKMGKNDFAYNPMNIRFGAVAKFDENKFIKISKYYNIFYCNSKVNFYFFEKYIKIKRMIDFYNKISTGSLNEKKRLHYSEFIEIEQPFPSLQEQEKIANFLSNIDKKISLTEEKLELFREYKKGVMQKIFSQELRFKDSEGNDYPEWEEKKLGEIAIFSKGRLISKEDISLNGVECIRYGELYTTYKEKIVDIVNKTNIDTDKLILSEKNDVIIPSSGETAIDIAVASCVMKDGVALGSDLNIIKTKENGLYLAYFINNPAKLELASLAQGASVIHLYEKHLKLLNIQLPILEEQQKIANFLSSIDTKIENIEKELEGLKEFKKGLLQQMFV